MAKDGPLITPLDVLQAKEGFSLADFDPSATPGFSGNSKDADKSMAARTSKLSDMQEMLFARGRTGKDGAVLLVVQGLDTAGKGGIVRHVAGLLDPQGLAIRSFGVPTEEERKHHYLWRVRKSLPPAGKIGVFDRSHYEDVLVVRVDELVAQSVWSKRYDEINRFEREIVDSGTTIVKVALMVSYDEQTRRLADRLERPDKNWKFNPGDIDTRTKWPAYQDAYQEVFDRTSTDIAPWHVIPADNKWYARLAVFELLYAALEGLDLAWPKVPYRVPTQLRRLAATVSPAWLNRGDAPAPEVTVPDPAPDAIDAEAAPAVDADQAGPKAAVAGEKSTKSSKSTKSAKDKKKDKNGKKSKKR